MKREECHRCKGTGVDPRNGPHKRRGPLPRYTDAEVLKAYNDNYRNGHETAIALKMDYRGTLKRLRKLLGGKLTLACPRKATDERLLAAYEKHRGHVKEMSAELEMAPGTVYNRLAKVGRRSSGSQQRRRHDHAAIKKIAEAVVQADGNLSAAAEQLGLSRERVRQIVNKKLLKGIGLAVTE